MLGDSSTSLCHIFSGDFFFFFQKKNYSIQGIRVPLCLGSHKNVAERVVSQAGSSQHMEPKSTAAQKSHSKESPRMTYGTLHTNKKWSSWYPVSKDGSATEMGRLVNKADVNFFIWMEFCHHWKNYGMSPKSYPNWE